MKVRIDKLLVERGMAVSRERAQAMVLAGRVLVDGQKVEKAGAGVKTDSEVRVLGEDRKFVSRGGLKLEAAFQQWKIDVNGRDCLDVGASTGGFTDCLLQNGAALVVALDTGYGQIAAKLRSHERVRLLEKTNARYLTQENLHRIAPQAEITFIAVDVSFISVTLILPAVLKAAFGGQSSRVPASLNHDLIVLVKPQFEAGREWVGKGGIVRDSEAQQRAVAKVAAAVKSEGGQKLEVIDSPILGMEGNREFLLRAEF